MALSLCDTLWSIWGSPGGLWLIHPEEAILSAGSWTGLDQGLASLSILLFCQPLIKVPSGPFGFQDCPVLLSSGW